MAAIDRKRLRRSFHLHSGEYDRHARVQKKVVERLSGLIAAGAPPLMVLDVGCGTGALVSRIAAYFPSARCVGVDLAVGMCVAARERRGIQNTMEFAAGDAERLPFRDSHFDLVVSASVFQWLDRLDAAFAEAFRVLAPGGMFRFALFGGATLTELRSSYRQASLDIRGEREERTMEFFSAGEVEAVLTEAGFDEAHVCSEMEVEEYPDVPSLLRAIRGIGAGTTTPPAARGLGERRIMLAMMDIYGREYGRNGMVPATYEVLYGTGRKPDAP
ncbi:MAG TPA: methyltransferase domain-containing protein [Geobacteraceae bacterium]